METPEQMDARHQREWQSLERKDRVHPSIAAIMAKHSRLSGFTVSELKGPSKKRPLARVRQQAMTEAYMKTPHSYSSVGRAFGGRDHTTVQHAIRAVQGRGGMTPAQQITECIHRLNQGETRADLMADGMPPVVVDAAIVARSERAQKENER